MTMLDGPTLMGIAAVITSLTNFAAALTVARNRGEAGTTDKEVPCCVPKRRSRLVARARRAAR
ncbi:MAG TPA: hypothetical protein VF695_01780 [Sphingomonas sp.]|jgi:hypothetical protein